MWELANLDFLNSEHLLEDLSLKCDIDVKMIPATEGVGWKITRIVCRPESRGVICGEKSLV